MLRKFTTIAVMLSAVLSAEVMAAQSNNDLSLQQGQSAATANATSGAANKKHKTPEQLRAEIEGLNGGTKVNTNVSPVNQNSQKSVSMENLVFESADPPKITDMQKQTLGKLNNYKRSPVNNTVFVNRDNVVFSYGNQTANVITSVLTVTDIELEPGEVVNSINLGDTARWNIEPAVTGMGDQQIQHVIVKPLDIGLKTNLIISTDRRGYRIELTSTANQYYPHVSFSYPEKLLAAFEAQRMIEKQEKEKQSITTVNNDGSQAKTYLGDLNFNYEVSGNVSWKPVRVFDDGRKTIIELPKKVEYAKAPALMLLSKKGGIFSDEKTDIINYRLQGNRYVVDGIFETAILTMGLDSQQQRVVITRGN